MQTETQFYLYRLLYLLFRLLILLFPLTVFKPVVSRLECLIQEERWPVSILKICVTLLLAQSRLP